MHIDIVIYKNVHPAFGGEHIFDCRGLTASAADPMACIENENSAMGLSIERTAIQYVAASGSIYVQHGSTIALGWFSLHTKWALNGP